MVKKKKTVKKHKGKKRDWTKNLLKDRKGDKKVKSHYNPRHGDKPYRDRVAKDKPHRPAWYGKD